MSAMCDAIFADTGLSSIPYTEQLGKILCISNKVAPQSHPD